MTLNNFNCWKCCLLIKPAVRCLASNGYVCAAAPSAPSAREHIISITVARGHVRDAILKWQKVFHPTERAIFSLSFRGALTGY
jgi:hypothetical protein